MKEIDFWTRRVRPALHDPARGWVAWKVPAEMRKGLPDVWFSFKPRSLGSWQPRVVSGWLELKYVEGWNTKGQARCDVTAEQLAHLREAKAGGSIAAVLMGVGPGWYLFDPDVLKPGCLVWDHVDAGLIDHSLTNTGASLLPHHIPHLAYVLMTMVTP